MVVDAMMTGKGTTYILLERGVEDVALLAELRDVVADVTIRLNGPKAFAKRFPHLLHLKQDLEAEGHGATN